MKKTLFLTYILAALLACSAVPQACGYDEEIGDYALTDWCYPDEDFVPNVLNVGEDADDESDDYWGDVVMDDPIYVWSTNGIITNGSVSCPVYIYAGSKLTLAAAQDGLRAADLVYWSGKDIDLSELDEDEKVMIYMYNNSTLDYRDKDVRLGRLTTYSGDTVYIQCGNLVTEEFGSTWDFTINAKIQLKDSNSHLWIARYTKSVTLKCEQNMNLVVGDDRAYIQDGQYYGVSGDGCKLNECALNLPDNKTSIIYGYLGGTSTITLGNGTILQGRYEAWDNGRGAYISWLTNNIEVRENCSALMTAGYYGGNITMQKGSSLQFYMGLVPAGVDEEHWYGGAGVFMKGGNTLDIGGGAHPFALIVEGEGNTVSHGTLLWNASSTGSASITNGSLTLKNDLTMAENATVSLNGDATLDLGGQKRAFGLTVAGTGNTLKNGAFIGTLTLAENSTLVSDSAMASWDGPTSIVMKNGSRLEMAVGYDEGKMAWRDCWINDISAIKVDGVATIKDAFIRIKPGTEYTLGNGVENLVGEGITSIALDNSIFNLDNKTTNLNIKVWAAFDRYNVIKNGTVNTHVEIDSTGKLALQNVTLGDNASFTMGNNTQLNLGGASIKLSKITLAESATATVDNGMLDLGAASYTLGIADAAAVIYLGQNHALQLGAGAAVGNGLLCLTGSTNDTPIDYTLNFQNGMPTQLTSNGVTLNLGEKVTFATNHNTRFLLNEECIGNPDCPVNINVTVNGHFILGDSSRDQTVYGDVNLTHTGDGPAATPGAYDVEMNYRLIGNLTAEMNGRSINIGDIGDDRQDTHPGTATVNGASDATVGSFTGEDLKLIAGGAVTFNGAVAATAGSVELRGASVSIGGSLAANNGSANITSTTGDISITGTLSALESNVLESAADITIGGDVTGGALTATAVQSITLQAITIGDKEADLTATNGSIAAAAFTGGSLTAKAAEAVTINGDVASTGNTTLSGASVGVNGSLTTLYGRTQIASTGGDIIIGGTLSSGTSSTLDSAENITIGGNMTGGALTATAAQSITLQAITIGGKAADLTATGGSISAESFTGGSLTAKAAGAVTFNGDVAASVGDAELRGSSVSIGGSLAASEASANITSTTGDIEITGTLNTAVSSTLDAAEDITVGGNMTGGALTAKAAQSITLQAITIGDNAAVLTAANGCISAESFTGEALTAGAAGAVTINGNVASTDNTDLTGTSVSINGSLTSSNGKNDIKSTSGDIVIAGDLSAAISSTLESAGSITLGTLDDNGVITAGGNVTGSTLTATAADSILMQNIGIGTRDAVLTAQNGSISAGNFIGNTLTASAGGSIKVGNIGSTSQAVGTVELTATNGGITTGNVTGGALTVTAGQSITAGNVTAGLLTATAAGTITLNDVAVSQSEAQIVSTGEGGNVKLNTFNGGGALIKATHGSITVATGVTGSASTNKNNFIAAGSVTFNGATGDNNLEHAIINAPQVNWSNGTTLKDVTVSHWAPPANSPLMLLAAGNGVPQATLTVNGFLELTESSTVNGNVVINKQDNIIPAVTVDHSTITGRVSGATELVLDSGRVGNVVVDNNSPNDLTVVSSGKSSITGVPFDPYVENYAKLRIATLSLNGGKLTVSPKALDYPDYPDDMENSDEEKARLQVATLMVANNTTVAADLELLPIGENEFSTMIFNLSAANETTACLTLEGDLLSYIPGGFTPKPGGKISISLNGNADVEGGKRYALIATNYDDKPEFWNDKNLTLTVSGLAQKTDDLSWENGTLYFQNGGELTRAVWSPETSHQWNTTDQNWLQDGHRYRYKDGVTVVFDDTGKGGVVELEGDYAPGEVQVNNSAENAYTFTGSGKITGESTKLIKMGSGKLTIQTANSYGGGTTINEGTLVVAYDEALGSGEVILEGGALEIDNGPKKFRLTVTGQNTRLEGGGYDAFTGTLTLKAGSQLNSSGGALMATQYGIDHIVMENGSTLTMTSDEDSAHRIWINKISEFTVYAGTEQDAPKLVDTYLYIDSGLTYKLGATTGENINSLQNLRGEGSTAFLLDSSTLDLNSKTTKLNIIVDNVLPQGPSTVMGGEIDANVVICERVNPNPFTEPNELEVTNARIGNNASISLGAGTRLIMSDVAIEAGATFSMGNEAYLDLGGTFAHPSSVSLGAFTFTGENTTIDNGSLYVERKETGAPVVLGTHLSGSDTRVSLHEEASLDLGGHVLSVKEVNMSEDAASASIGKGTLNSALAVESGKTLHLGNALTIAGNLSGSGTITKENDGTASVSGGMEGFTGNVQVQGGELNIMGIAEAANLKMADVTIMSGTLGVYQGGTTGEENEGTLTIRSSHTLAAGNGATLNANLVMERNSTLDVHSTEGAGLHMGSTVTLSTGMTLAGYGSDWAAWKNGTKYVLFSGVDGLDISNGNGIMTGTLDYTQWVDAKEYFTNIEESNRYFLCYNGGNVGTVYIMQMLEHATATLIWNGSAGHMTWDATDTNWLLGDQSTTHMDSADVVFNGTGAGGVVQLGGELAPMSVLVEGTCDYTFTGTGRLIGNVALTKEGTGTLTIENANNYSGDTIIKGGTLALGYDATLGSGTITLEENGTLKLANGTFANDIQGNGTLVKGNSGTANVTGSMEDFSGNVVVDRGTLNLMNAASLNVADVTINIASSLGVYTGGVAAEANEGTLTITGGHKLTAGMGATLNANLVMGGGVEAPAVLDVSAMAGLGGLQMGSTVTLTPGLVLLSAEDMDAVGALGFMGKYDLFNSVDGLSLDGTSNFLAELGLADKWVKAGDVFANDLFKEAEKEYYVFYSGANQAGGNGGNVGTVYIMQIPEPTTSTLSLLALAALAARRRK